MLVKAKVDCFPDGTFRHAGEEFEYSGPKNENLVPVKAPKGEPAGIEETEKEK